jgi:hypothetical protein
MLRATCTPVSCKIFQHARLSHARYSSSCNKKKAKKKGIILRKQKSIFVFLHFFFTFFFEVVFFFPSCAFGFRSSEFYFVSRSVYPPVHSGKIGVTRTSRNPFEKWEVGIPYHFGDVVKDKSTKNNNLKFLIVYPIQNTNLSIDYIITYTFTWQYLTVPPTPVSPDCTSHSCVSWEILQSCGNMWRVHVQTD